MLRSVVDVDAIEAVAPMTGGASGALVYRLRIAGCDHVLRIETARDPLRDPHRTYPCMRIAAEAGVAPPLSMADPVAGVVLMDFVDQRPLSEHPGATVGVLREIGQLVARLQRAPLAPPLLDLPALLDVMLGMVESSDVFAAGVLEPIRVGFGDVVASYPWSWSEPVTSHNDINPFNVLYDGSRLWLIDWELAFRNDPLADVAGAVNNLGDSLDVDDVTLAAWAGTDPDPTMTARLTLIRALNHLYYGAMVMSMFIGTALQLTSLDAPTPDQFRADAAAGLLLPGSADALQVLGRMHLAAFARAAVSPAVARAGEVIAAA